MDSNHEVYYAPGTGKTTPSYDVGTDDKPTHESTTDTAPTRPATEGSSTHPIDSLIRVAESDFTDILARESSTLAEAAAAYRERRGRHPPPGFKAWYEFAKKNKAVMVEDFWDQVYHDLNPFWGVDPQRIRTEAWDFEMTINIRNGKATAESDWFWTQIWLNMTKTIEQYLPDMDLALNAMDEPRLVVPWEDINGYMQKEKKSRHLIPAKEVISEFSKLPDPETGYTEPAVRDKDWEDTGMYKTPN